MQSYDNERRTLTHPARNRRKIIEASVPKTSLKNRYAQVGWIQCQAEQIVHAKAKKQVQPVIHTVRAELGNVAYSLYPTIPTFFTREDEMSFSSMGGMH